MIHYFKGDATAPKGRENKFICHVCNNRGGWGKGFVKAISKRWPEPEERYREFANSDLFGLGRTQFIWVEAHVCVVNMIAQDGYRNVGNIIPLRYQALKECFERTSSEFAINDNSFHMPRLGCGLAGGDWGTVENIILKTFPSHTPIYVYDL